jgi:RNA polymerase sigma factor (sigma-70 family)
VTNDSIARRPARRTDVSEVTQGDEWFMQKIDFFIREETNRLFGWVKAQVRDHNAADDIVQETFLGFIKAAITDHEIIEPPLIRAQSLLYTIAGRRIKDLIRSKKRQRTETLEFEPKAGIDEARMDLEREEVVEEIRKRLSKEELAKYLDEREIDVLLSTKCLGESDDSVAGRLNIKKTNLRKIRQRAIEKLIDALGSRQ